jgi:Tfp pilus assembly pilus retraction ATPase PilT
MALFITHPHVYCHSFDRRKQKKSDADPDSIAPTVEYLHESNRASFSQREYGRDFYNFSFGLRAALRQTPPAILVGEIRDRETMEVAITAGETGHLVFTSLHTINASQTINRILGMFDEDEEALTRQRLADTLRWVVSQRLVPRIDGGLHLATEVMGSNLRSREVILMGESEKRNRTTLLKAVSLPGAGTASNSPCSKPFSRAITLWIPPSTTPVTKTRCSRHWTNSRPVGVRPPCTV